MNKYPYTDMGNKLVFYDIIYHTYLHAKRVMPGIQRRLPTEVKRNTLHRPIELMADRCTWQVPTLSCQIALFGA